MNTLIPAIQELYKIFNYLNKELYNSEVKQPIFNIASKRPTILGWCTINKVWINENEQFYEIGITAENLKRPYVEIAETVNHEIVHLYNLQNGINDCAGKVHNKKFKSEAERRLLKVEKGKYGWAYTSATEEFVKLIEKLEKDENAFSMYRKIIEKPAKEKAVKYTYICPKCKRKVNAKEEIKVECKDCGMIMMEKGEIDG